MRDKTRREPQPQPKSSFEIFNLGQYRIADDDVSDADLVHIMSLDREAIVKVERIADGLKVHFKPTREDVNANDRHIRVLCQAISNALYQVRRREEANAAQLRELRLRAAVG